ncbi:hypothetical protein TRVL_06152 [Trypanosoma vivax]|nr:hypothetical protein TRVL_06152 [Trypanosoma vivax]
MFFYTQLLSAVPDRTFSKKICPIHPAPFTSFSFRESARCAECALSGCAPFQSNNVKRCRGECAPFCLRCNATHLIVLVVTLCGMVCWLPRPNCFTGQWRCNSPCVLTMSCGHVHH